jgi:putative ABC transport system substrate-binding protein
MNLGSAPQRALKIRPGGNVTGVTFLANVLAAKPVELVSELAPRATAIGILVNPNNPNAVTEAGDKTRREIGRRLASPKPQSSP